MAQQPPQLPPDPDDLWEQDQALFIEDIARRGLSLLPEVPLPDEARPLVGWDEDVAHFVADLQMLAAATSGIHLRALEVS